MKKLVSFLLLLLVILLTACQQQAPPTPTAVPPTATAMLPTPIPTSTATAVPLTVAWSNDVYPEKHYSQRAVSWQFSQPMTQAGNLEELITFTPPTNGEFTWSENNTRLTFTPKTALLVGRTYTIDMKEGLTAVDGQSLPTPTTFSLTIGHAPTITSRSPVSSDLTTPQLAFSLNFSQAMDHESIAQNLTVDPVIPLDLVWEGDTLHVTSSETLTLDTNYFFRLSTEATNLTGIPLNRVYQWQYALVDLTATVGGATTNRTNPIRLSFNYSMNPTTVEKATTFDPPLEGTWSWDINKKLATFTPTAVLPPNTSYTVHFGESLFGASGLEFPAPNPITFQTHTALLSNSPEGAHVSTSKPVTIQFDAPVDHEQIAAALHISPEIEGEVTWEGETLTFRPSLSHWASDSDYTVTLDQDITDLNGRSLLTQDFVWTFHTEYVAATIYFGSGPNIQVLNTDGRRAIQFGVSSKTPGAIQFDLYRFNPTDFATTYSRDFGSDYGSEQPIHPALGQLAKSWTEEPTVIEVDWFEIAEVILPEDVPSGLYVLTISDGRSNDQLFLVVSQNNLVVKSDQGQALVWASTLDGRPAADAEITIFDKEGKVLVNGRSDENGLYRTALNTAQAPQLVIAQSGDDTTISGINEYGWGTYTSGLNYGNRQHYDTYVYTDRPIYRPGQWVNFKAAVRQDNDAVLDIVPEGTPVTVRIRDGRNNTLQTFQFTTNSFGTVNGQFQIAEGGGLGTYQVEVKIGEEITQQRFLVEDYRKPDFTVTVTPSKTNLVDGDTFQVTIDTAYFFGEPVPNATITLQTYDMYNSYWQPAYGNSQTQSGTTDEKGQATFVLSAQYNGYNDYDYWYWRPNKSTLGIEATIDDGSHQTVTGFASVNVYQTSALLTIKRDSYLQRTDTPFSVNTSVTDIDGRPVVNRSVTIAIAGWDTHFTQKQTINSGDNGQANASFTLTDPGYYEITATSKDAQGHSLETSSWLYVLGDGQANWYGSNSSLKISTDRNSYAPGDTAKLLIESQIGGPALLTFQRATIRRDQFITLTPPFTIVEVPIQNDDAPNIFAMVQVWQSTDSVIEGNESNSQPDGRLNTAAVNLVVSTADKVLTVTITPNKTEYAPRENASFTVHVTNAAGTPVSAEVSLGMVDEAIYSLSADLSVPIAQAFYFQRGNLVNTYHSLVPSRSLYPPGECCGMGGGGGGDEGGAPRFDFPDTAEWFPVLHTDFNGDVVVEVTLPDSLTSWRLTAKALTADTQVGETTANIITKKEVIVRPILPDTLTAGDTIQLSTLVHNYSDQAQTLTLSLAEAETAFLQLPTETNQSLTLAPGSQQIVGWSVKAMAAGEAQIVVQAKVGDAVMDAVQLPLMVRPLAIPDVTTQLGSFQEMFETNFTMPNNALPISKISLDIDRSIAGSVVNGLEYLTGYPYGCVEQTMSRALPTAVVARALNQLGIETEQGDDELKAKINASVQRLYGFQHTDGGWGWWFDDATNHYQTAWVVFGLSVIKDAGYEVDPAVIERGVAYINNNLGSMDARTRAYALYSIAMAGAPNSEANLDLMATYQTLDAFSQAGLALALQADGETTKAKEIVDYLATTAVHSNSGVYWQGDGADGHYTNKTMASDTRNTALVLSAFIAIRPGHALEGDIVAWLMSQRRAEGWGSTNETSFTILALTDHLLRIKEAVGPSTYTVNLNGQQVAEGVLDSTTPTIHLEFGLDALQTGENHLQVSQSGPIALYYRLNNTTYLAQSKIEAAGDVQIERTYLNPITNRPITEIEAGALVEVRLTVHMPKDVSYVIVEDTLPSGLEALNERLNTTSKIDAYTEPTYYWYEYGYNYKEIRDGRVSFFITEMDQNTYTYTYTARATHSGSFTAMPVQAYAMYDTTVWGRSDSTLFTIHE